ncbi:hypothetical protein [Pyrobaculum ferrireducens]|nr:hypothetical protein [Pyrobaculum ferrireducens]
MSRRPCEVSLEALKHLHGGAILDMPLSGSAASSAETGNTCFAE